MLALDNSAEGVSGAEVSCNVLLKSLLELWPFEIDVSATPAFLGGG